MNIECKIQHLYKEVYKNMGIFVSRKQVSLTSVNGRYFFSNFRMESLMDGEKTSIPMEDIMKDLFWAEFLMALVDLLWKMAIFTKERLSLVEPMATDISKLKMANIVALSKTTSDMDMVSKQQTN